MSLVETIRAYLGWCPMQGAMRTNLPVRPGMTAAPDRARVADEKSIFVSRSCGRHGLISVLGQPLREMSLLRRNGDSQVAFCLAAGPPPPVNTGRARYHNSLLPGRL